MTVTPFQNFISRLDKGSFIGQNKDRMMACCPAHPDRFPSLMVSERKDGSVGLHCFAGCDKKDILGAIGLDWIDCFADGTDARVMIAAKHNPLSLRELAQSMAIASLVIRGAATRIRQGYTLLADEDECLTHYSAILLRAEELINGKPKR